jgi:hypothetical protein
MSTMYTHDINDVLAQFVTNLVQLLPADLFEVVGGIELL